MLSKYEQEVLLKYKDIIEMIVNSKACSYIPSDLLDVIEGICNRDRVSFCRHCPSTLYRSFVYVHGLLTTIGQESTERKKTKKKKDGD